MKSAIFGLAFLIFLTSWSLKRHRILENLGHGAFAYKTVVVPILVGASRILEFFVIFVVCISYLGVVHEDSTVVRLHIAIFPGSWHSERYEKLLCMVDLTKDFYFSYSYNVMRSLQKNMCDKDTGLALYETMFVWNEFLTRGIRNILQNTIWTVALVCGFFNQISKRGVNEKGRVAKWFEMEKILAEDVPEGLRCKLVLWSKIVAQYHCFGHRKLPS
ncbi:UNVERIFIED_CONTAM: Phosphoinositide phosphatase SAC3 [Sesamum radiatum]|uniref:Phosphoinositide phosphatase SAC3 n=1 Tax=Sesamum radiatum TaxID=300843 RepID=A0AAW2M507_SESRA